MNRGCIKCGAPLTKNKNKCDYCGEKYTTVIEKFRNNENAKNIPSEQKIMSFFGIVAILIIFLSAALYRLDPTPPEKIEYVCYGALSRTTDASDVETTVIVQSLGAEISRWIERDTIVRQSYVDHYWGSGWDLSDRDIREWFEGPYNVMETEGTFWNLVSIDENYIVTDFIFDYLAMSESDLNRIWEPNFSRVNRNTAIRVLEDDGANCVRR